jgi:hypothetical protein
MLLPAVTLAQEDNVSYNFFDIDYFRTDWDFGTSESSGTGWMGRFSVGIRNHVFVTGEYRAGELDESDLGSTYKRLGFGVHGSIGDNWSIYGEAGFKSYDLDSGSGNVEEDPGYFGGGIRWYLSDGFELRFAADYNELGSNSPAGIGEVSMSVGGDIYVTDAAALTIEVAEDDENTTTFLIGMRFYPKKDTSALRQSR